MQKYISYILILIVLIGLFSPTVKMLADSPSDPGTCEGISGLGRPSLRSECPIPPNRSFVPDQVPPTPLGTCTGINETAGNISCDRKDLTFDQCKAYTNSSNCRFIDWIENGKCEPPKTIMGGKCVTLKCTAPLILQDGKCVTPPPTKDPLGTCTVSVSEGPPNITTGQTKKQCDAAGGVWSADTNYNFLAPLPCTGTPETGCVNGKLTTFDPTGDNKIGGYLNIIINLFIGICAVLAVIMIVVGGIEYMTSELPGNKEHGKERITGAIFGLILALGAWTLLYQINPDLLNTDLTSLKNVTVTIQPLYDRGATDPKQANGESTRCTPVLSGPCSVANLTPIFGDKAVAMSKICNMESGGTNAASSTDVCKPGNNSFSFGLFQVNLAANGILAGADCVGLFDKKVSGADAISPKYTSGFSCSLLSGKETLYNTCKARLLDPNTNLAIAKSLFSNSSGINNWIGDKKYCASAFN